MSLGYFSIVAQKKEQKINFSGYEWTVRNNSEKQGPGPNYFDPSCVTLDAKGWLHLVIKKDLASDKWVCPEITTVEKFGFGTYCFVIEGAVDHFDKNIVLGLFNYSGNDGYDEMDIEIARWGNDRFPNLNYTIWPNQGDTIKQVSATKEFILSSSLSTHCFRRNADTVVCAGFNGISTASKDLIFTKTFVHPVVSISQLKMPVHINFWLFEGSPPLDQRPVEIVIRSFTFTK
jgi:hypothetical protein